MCTQRPIPGFENYRVSADGEVFSVAGLSTKPKRQMGNGRGYLQVSLTLARSNPAYRLPPDRSKRHINERRRLVHRLVWEAHVGPIPSNMVVDHVDGDKTNNALSNLRVVTQKDNVNSPVTRQRALARIAKLTPADVAQIRNRMWKSHTGTGPKLTQPKLAAEYGITVANVQAILYRKSWKDVPDIDPCTPLVLGSQRYSR